MVQNLGVDDAVMVVLLACDLSRSPIFGATGSGARRFFDREIYRWLSWMSMYEVRMTGVDRLVEMSHDSSDNMVVI